MLSNLITHRTLPLIVGIPVVALVVIVGLTLKPPTRAATNPSPALQAPAQCNTNDTATCKHYPSVSQYHQRKLELRGQTTQ
jgi:hypothetical protein